MDQSAKTHSENHLHDVEPRWFAVRTRFRDEKVALQQLTLNGIHAYLPIKKLARRYGRKVRYVQLPLINGFVFVKILKKDYHVVLQTQYAAGFLKFGNNLLSIPESEINLIKRLLNEEVEIDVTPTALIEGDWVEVVSGPLLGMQGQFVEEKGKGKVVVNLSYSGFSLHITVDPKLLTKISAPTQY